MTRLLFLLSIAGALSAAPHATRRDQTVADCARAWQRALIAAGCPSLNASALAALAARIAQRAPRDGEPAAAQIVHLAHGPHTLGLSSTELEAACVHLLQPPQERPRDQAGPGASAHGGPGQSASMPQASDARVATPFTTVDAEALLREWLPP